MGQVEVVQEGADKTTCIGFASADEIHGAPNDLQASVASACVTPSFLSPV